MAKWKGCRERPWQPATNLLKDMPEIMIDQ